MDFFSNLVTNKALLKNNCFIDGQWVSSIGNNNISVLNPFDNQEIARIPILSDDQVYEAINAAQRAFMKWKNLLPSERSLLMRRWFDLILENAQDLAKILVLEQGKPLKEALGEIKYSASYIEFYAEEATRIYGDILPSPFPDSKIFISKQPLGVVGIITPWNFPSAMMIRKIAPAIACGCTCVVKPDETTPLTAFAFAELANQAGIPNGVMNFITGIPSKIGEILCNSNIVRKISFTGSIEVGKTLMRQSANTVKKITLELGGNAPFIVFKDADIEAAVAGLIDSKFRNAGQTCVCANRVFIQNEIEEEFVTKLVEKVVQFKVGSGFENCEIGPLINKNAVKKMEGLIKNSDKLGGKIMCGGNKHFLGSNFFEPTIITRVTPNMEIFMNEVFGPIIPITTFETVSEVISLANSTNYGLASYFYTKNMENIWKVSEELEFGMVGINTGIISSASVPFGGVKESGFGREGSRYGLDDYLSLKYINLKK
jgi:succinate-semialdehyde dehydrogenase/glutarate-semialdehyde dehydrogenase